MKFQYIAEYRGPLTRSHLCRLVGVTERGRHAWKHRPPSHRQRRDMVLLAHIRDQHRLSLGSYDKPRMTDELHELGIRVGLFNVFKTIKVALIWRRSWETLRQAETANFQYINGFYNPRRRHSALGRHSALAEKGSLAFKRQLD